jgi:glycogen operon protein
MIAFRKGHPALRHPLHAGRRDGAGFLEVTWHGTRAWQPDWSPGSRALALMLRGGGGLGPEDVLYVALNSFWEPLTFALPAAPVGRRWHVFANTGMAPPEDVWEVGAEPPLGDQGHFRTAARSAVLLVAR